MVEVVGVVECCWSGGGGGGRVGATLIKLHYEKWGHQGGDPNVACQI